MAKNYRDQKGVNGPNYKHGMLGTKEHLCWGSMKSRCGSPTNKDYDNYGGRGIKVCSRWLNSFTNFLADMGPAPSPRHFLDRIDNNKGYSLKNCRWVTIVESGRNRRTVKLSMEIAKKIRADKRPQREIAEQYGVAISVISRIKNNKRWAEPAL